jgi:chromosome segregation ATPase
MIIFCTLSFFFGFSGMSEGAVEDNEPTLDVDELLQQLRMERQQRKHLELELKAERETIEQLLNQMDNLELEARASNEEISGRERILQQDLLSAQRALDDERSIRLQHLYELSRSQEEVEAMRNDVRKLNESVLGLQDEIDAQKLHIESLEASLRTSKRITEQCEVELRSTTSANLIHKQDTQVLRLRLVEVEKETTHWRLINEEAAAAGARQRNEMAKIYHKQRLGQKPSGAATMGRSSSNAPANRRQSASGLGELPALH